MVPSLLPPSATMTSASTPRQCCRGSNAASIAPASFKAGTMIDNFKAGNSALGVVQIPVVVEEADVRLAVRNDLLLFRLVAQQLGVLAKILFA